MNVQITEEYDQQRQREQFAQEPLNTNVEKD